MHTIHRFDWDSPQKAVRFADAGRLYTIGDPQPSHVAIFEIQTVKFGKNGEVITAPYGYSILPLFRDLEADGDVKTTEIYVNSGIYQLPIFKDEPEPDFV